MELFIPNKLKDKVTEWRGSNYKCNYPTIEEILEYSFISNEIGIQSLRYLRKAQIEALETYWYLRLVENTPKIIELYDKLYDNPKDKFEALGIKLTDTLKDELIFSGKGIDSIFERIKTDNTFVKKNNLQAVQETLSLNYPSYILALAMGAGKTVLIGSIIASEFAMALEHEGNFVKNALVFAPGKTILGALKEISNIPYELILPPRLYKQFITSVKFTYTQDGQKDIPIIERSNYNIVVTNTEKIRIQKPTGKRDFLPLLNLRLKEKVEEKIEETNLRLRKIASLPNLAIFSDEAHHTYGQNLEKGLKKVRKTVDYLANETNLIVVVNTTGTPYYKKQILKDVIYWYGLSQGIADGILKELQDSIFSYDKVNTKEFLKEILKDFFNDYKDVKLSDGTLSKLAIYFPNTDDVKKVKSFVEREVISYGLDPSTVLEVNNKSDEKLKDFFNNRINEKDNPYRIYLLVNMGTEGWNVPSLFATALARKLKTSNNFVLQSASRCLRQLPDNKVKARIYLSADNVKILDSQLRETYKESLEILNNIKTDLNEDTIELKKVNIPKILIKKRISKVEKQEVNSKEIKLVKPDISKAEIEKTIYELRSKDIVKEVLSKKDFVKVETENDLLDIYEVANELSKIYRLDLFTIFDKLKEIYSDGDILYYHLPYLMKQIEEQTSKYKTVYEDVEIALALIKPEGFNKIIKNGEVVYTAEIMYNRTRGNYIFNNSEVKELKSKGLSFHYNPYNMDSSPEKDFLKRMLEKLDEDPDDIEGIYFTGAFTDSKKTDFVFEYKNKIGKWSNYTPDFVIMKKNGKVLIVEIKGEKFKNQLIEDAMKEVIKINPDKLKYELVATNNDEVQFSELQKVRNWIYEEAKEN